MSIDDDLRLAPDVDPSRWPFDERRARAATAAASAPDPAPLTGGCTEYRRTLRLAYRAGHTARLPTRHDTQRAQWETRRRTTRERTLGLEESA